VTAMSDHEMSRRMRDAARTTFLQALAEASIAKAFARHVHCERGVLRICEDLYDLQTYSRIFVVSIGKAGHTMVDAFAHQLGESALEGIVASSAIFAVATLLPMPNPSMPPRRF
jgi:glycerate-2-kinase